ncbi:protein SUPPRESSOR OF MAX2 1 [Punica granatum]|uniref:Protein SUPPRESSOR OF MAX2 1 n=1 Tax=Punica granatum TaxID=22663 RepID=A0A218VZG6_PUNGR|nr:protein SUPPRESSOR OF MAX2 1 [Punica granatum]OWM65885.1 hypothetical protein CDL15_Pgr015310 [Punica granatum]
MRAGLSTIQQTLTPEAAGVLNLSIAEAARRNHGQTTPLHVAATLLAAPSGFLRQACIKSHPNSSHPLQCRALELCFSVALERLPTAQGSTLEPPISNALMAALKRAQAHQRRGCPEQQQQPLLAVKVELEQLIISILDDPSVSRVMREASFSSPAVKATIEQSLNSTAPPPPGASPASVGLGFRPSVPTRNLYLNPRLQQQQGSTTSATGAAAAGPQAVHQRSEDVKKVIEILSRSRKRNPVLVGESEPEAVVRELVKRIEAKEVKDEALQNVQVISLEKEFGSDKSKRLSRLKELGDLVEARMVSGGIILDFGDLKWLVEQAAAGFGSAGPIPGQPPPRQVVSEVARVAVAEVAKLLERFREDGNGSGGRVWLIGTATCETYMRCQVHHPSMETDWDLQAVPIAARAPLPGLFPRLGTTGILGNTVESLSPLKNFSSTISNPSSRRLSENLDPTRKTSCCPKCTQGYEQELAKLKTTETEKSSPEVKSEPAARPALPQWLQNAKVHPTQGKDEEIVSNQRIQELQKKWNETCRCSHPHFHQPLIGPERINPTPFSMTGLYTPNPLLRQNLEPKSPLLHKSLNVEVQTQTPLLKPNPMMQNHPTLQVPSSPGSPVRTDLVLGRTKATKEPTLEKPAQKEGLRDFLGCISSGSPKKVYEFHYEKLMSISDTDSFKKLLKGLADSVWWQRDAASAVATIMNRSKLGNAKRRSIESRGDLWILFAGPDRVGKKKMGSALSELVCGAAPITISFGSRRENDLNFRGKTALDRIAEGVRRNPFSVIILEDVDEADVLVRGSIKRAMERGRIADSHGREISLGNVTFILTVNWVPDNVKFATKLDSSFDEEKLAGLAQEGWRLKLSVSERTAKRRASWLHDVNMAVKLRKEMGNDAAMGFDLNEAADYLDDRTDGSRNSSDITVEHEYDHGLDNRLSSTSLVYRELLCNVDDSVIFKPVGLASLREDIASSISSKISSVFGDRISVEVEGEALERILGGVWLGRTGLEEWMESVLITSFDQLKARLSSRGDTRRDESMVVRLECDGSTDPRGYGEWLPRRVEVAVDGL